MATLRNKKKLAAFSRETQENTRNSGSQNEFNPGMAEAYITEVSEGVVSKNFADEVSRMESRSLGASSKLDENLLNPQVWTCSVVNPGLSKRNNLENQETTGDRCVSNPCPEMVFSSCLT